MKIILTCLLTLFMIGQGVSQSFHDQILTFRESFKSDMLKDQRAPLREDDFQHLRWFLPNDSFRVKCQFTPLIDSDPVDVPTSSGRVKSFQDIGVLSFVLANTVCTLHVYTNRTLASTPEYQDHLFLPFTDPTNGEQTYGGGRYIDLTRSQLTEEEIWLDFNLAYNPWCAYSDGYNCPIPPMANRLTVPVRAGEQMYTGQHKSRDH